LFDQGNVSATIPLNDGDEIEFGTGSGGNAIDIKYLIPGFTTFT
jgi:hypothetical protein